MNLFNINYLPWIILLSIIIISIFGGLILVYNGKLKNILKTYFNFIPNDLLINQQITINKDILIYKSINIFDNNCNIINKYNIKKDYELNYILKLIKELTYFPYSDRNIKIIINCDNKNIYLALSHLFFSDTRINEYTVISDSVRNFSWNTYGSDRYQIVEIVYTHQDERRY